MSLSDKVPGVYLASVSLLKMLAGSRILTARECSAAVADTAPLLIEKVCTPQNWPLPNETSGACHCCQVSCPVLPGNRSPDPLGEQCGEMHIGTHRSDPSKVYACSQAGENNARVQAAAVEALLHLAGNKDAALSSQAALFVRPENQTQWKRILGRYRSADRHPPDLQASAGCH